MLTGSYETPDGVIHTEAVGLCYPLVLQTWPEKAAKAGLDFNIWHNAAAMQAEKQPIAILSFSVDGPALRALINVDMLAPDATQSLVRYIVAQMENVVKQRAEFSEWVAV